MKNEKKPNSNSELISYICFHRFRYRSLLLIKRGQLFHMIDKLFLRLFLVL